MISLKPSLCTSSVVESLNIAAAYFMLLGGLFDFRKLLLLGVLMCGFSLSVKFLKTEIVYIAFSVISHLLTPDPCSPFPHLCTGDHATYLASHTRLLCPSHELITGKVLGAL